MQFRSWARGEGELYSRKAARWRDARSGGLNRKRQRTGNSFAEKILLDKILLDKILALNLFSNGHKSLAKVSRSSLRLVVLFHMLLVSCRAGKQGKEASFVPYRLSDGFNGRVFMCSAGRRAPRGLLWD